MSCLEKSRDSNNGSKVAFVFDQFKDKRKSDIQSAYSRTETAQIMLFN